MLVFGPRHDRTGRTEQARAEPSRTASAASLRAALADAADAVSDPGDPRRAIIASYAAMEARLTKAGAAPAAADTPAEVLARAADADLVQSPGR